MVMSILCVPMNFELTIEYISFIRERTLNPDKTKNITIIMCDWNANAKRYIKMLSVICSHSQRSPFRFCNSLQLHTLLLNLQIGCTHYIRTRFVVSNSIAHIQFDSLDNITIIFQFVCACVVWCVKLQNGFCFNVIISGLFFVWLYWPGKKTAFYHITTSSRTNIVGLKYIFIKWW